MDILEKIKTIIQYYSTFYKPALIISMISGAIYLNGFLRSFGIPFPLEINVLPSTLLVIGVLSLLIVLITSLYATLVTTMNYDPLNTGYHIIINTSKSGVFSLKIKNYLKLNFFVYLLPFLTLFIIIYKELIPLGYIFSFYFYIVLALWSIIVSLFILIKKRKYIKNKQSFFLTFTIHIFIFQNISLLSFALFYLIITPRIDNITDLKLLITLIFYLSFNYLLLLPIFSKKKLLELTKNKTHKLTPESIITQTQNSPAWAIIVFMVLASFLPQISSYVGELPLKLMNLGGGSSFVVTDEIKQCNSWPNFIISKKDNNSCRTKEGKLIIQLGSRAYAIFNDGQYDKVVNLDLSKSSIVTDLPKDYIRL